MSTTEPHWLNADEEAVWRAWLEASGRIANSVESDLRASDGLDHADYEVLVRLSESAESRLRMSELATEVVSSPSKLSQRIDRLERAGLVARERCPSDKRGLFAVITAAGTAKLQTAAPGHVDSVRRSFLDHLSPDDLQLLRAVLPKLAEATRES